MPSAKCILLATMLMSAVLANAQEGGDTQARIEYAYQTEDSNSLASLIQILTSQVKSDDGDSTVRYHFAHAQYRMGQLLHEHRAQGAEPAFSECIDALKPVLEKDRKSAEGLVLQASCYSGLAELKSLEAALLRARTLDRLQAALKLEPHNPRALLLSATRSLRSAKPGSAERQRGFAELQAAAQSFEQSSGTSIETPGWGHAEAYLALGTEMQARGDQLGARNWIEKALLAAPDFKLAQRQLALLAKP